MANRVYSLGIYEQAILLYNKNRNEIDHNAHLLLKYALISMEQNKFEQAIELLNQAEKVGCGTDMLYKKAICYEKLGRYEMAEATFQKSIFRNPIRLYPYYMLLRLYASPEYLHKQKVKDMANIVLHKKVKKESEMVEMMRKSAREIVDKMEQIEMNKIAD